MADTPTRRMNLSQALTYKKRVQEEISNVSRKIQRLNSVPVHVRYDNEGYVIARDEPSREGNDIRELVEKRSKLKEHLLDLKMELWNKSQPIRKMILQLSELKDDAIFWSNVFTQQGVVPNRMDHTFREYNTVVDSQEVEEKQREIRRQIDSYQATIDEFNHTTYVEIEDIGVV